MCACVRVCVWRVCGVCVCVVSCHRVLSQSQFSLHVLTQLYPTSETIAKSIIKISRVNVLHFQR